MSYRIGDIMNLIIHRGTHEIGGSCVELAPQYDESFFFQDGLAGTIQDGKCGFIDKTGKEIFRADKAFEDHCCCFII